MQAPFGQKTGKKRPVLTNWGSGRRLTHAKSIVTRVPPFRVLFVCIGNICRSPLGERLLAAQLPADQFVVESAGVMALVGSEMNPEAATLLASYGGTADGFHARQVTAAMLQDADLILTATKDIRSRVLEDAPAALRRTFTVLEFAALLDQVDEADTLAELVRNASAARSEARLDDYDIPDPYRQGAESHQLAAKLMEHAVTRIAAGLDQ
ncbi:MAG: low molecular weight phosphatase family protein [Marmoricola sp.]|nr:low molecular weight phosphatase family protein [Marmoricola sp.]